MRYLTHRFGYRGAALVVAGAAWVVFGTGISFMDQPARPWVIVDHVPPLLEAAGWWATGILGIRHGYEGDQHDDTSGFAVMMVMPMIRVAAFTFGWLVWAATSLVHLAFGTPVTGYSQGWYAAFVWGFPVVLLYLIALIPNPRVVVPQPPGAA